MYKYFYNIDKKIYSYNLSEDITTLNDFSNLSANHTADYIRNLVSQEHRNLITVLNEQTNILYHINVNAIDRILLNNNSELQIEFTDNTLLTFSFEGTNQTEFIYSYVKNVYYGNNLVLYKYNKSIYYVHPDFTNGGNNYNNIQDCINVMSAGDYMYVYAGTYSESLTIDKSIDIEFQDGVIIDSGSSVNLIFEANVFVKIFGNVTLNSETHNITTATGQSVYMEFDSITSETNYNISGGLGNLILKGNEIISLVERNMYEFSENKNLFDVLNFITYTNDNLHCNGIDISSEFYLAYLNTRFQSNAYNFNIEHAEGADEIAMTVNFFNCLFYVTSNTTGSLSTYTGGTVNPVNINLHSCYFDTPVNTTYDIYTFINNNNYGELNVNYYSNAYGKRGTTSASEGLYITEGNGREFIIDSQINIAGII